ncbi:MAG: hypothetical protein JST80_10090 [Bdellovibrionales bacterium]|nr:hypothetical protein [Bdellovibrionales bacterium]
MRWRPGLGFTLGLAAISTAHAGYVNETHLWKNQEVPVCFANSAEPIQDVNLPLRKSATFIDNGRITIRPETADDLKVKPLTVEMKALIRQVIEISFTASATGIHYVGFNDCPPALDRGIAIYFNDIKDDYELASSNIGQYAEVQTVKIGAGALSDFQTPVVKGADPAKEWDEFGQSYFLTAVVHEFGHAAGLWHEHERADGSPINHLTDLTAKEWLSNRFDNDRRDSKSDINSPEFQKKFVKVGEYSLFSIMNYMVKSYMPFARNMQVTCQKTPCADQTYLRLLPTSIEQQRSLLHSSDTEVLAHEYLGRPIINAFLPEQAELAKYLAAQKPKK